jgi:tetratricopeptide (TPR) repeat protein
MVATAQSAILSTSRAELLHQLPDLRSKSAQANFLAAHRELLNTETVTWLRDSINDQAKADAGRAKPLAELAMMIARKIKDRSALAHSFRAMGNALYLERNNKSAVVYHEKARKLFVALRDRSEVARTLVASTQPLILIGNYRRALSNAKQARRLLSVLGDRGRLARLDVNTGNIFLRQDRFSEALKWYRRAHRHFRENERRDPEGMGVALHNIAMCLVILNDFHGALAAHKETRQVADRYGMQVLAGQADYNIAGLYHLRGENTRAIRMLLATRETCRKANDPYHVALCNLDLSEIYLQLNLHGPAEEMAQEASSGFQDLGIGYEAGKSLVNLALAMAGQNRFAPALEILKNVRRQFTEEENSAWPFQIDLYRSAILVERGHTRDAQQLCAGALRFFRTAGIPSKIVLCQLLLARSYLRAGKLRSAIYQCSTALATLSKVDLPIFACQAQQLMGRVELQAGRTTQAYRHYQAARKLLEGMRSDLRSEELKISFMEDKIEIYESLVQLCLDDNRNRLEEAFQYIEQMKSRSLQELIASGGTGDSEAGPGDSIQQRTTDLRGEINWYSNRFAEEQLRGSSAKVLDGLRATILKREKELLRMTREMPAIAAESVGLSSSQAAAVEQIRNSLPAGGTLLEYFQVRDKLLAVLLTHKSLEFVPVTKFAEVTAPLERLEFQLAKFRLGAEYLKTFGESLLETTKVHLQELHRLLISPVEKRLEGEQIIVVPHGSLHRLPFQALFDGSHYLIDKFQIAYAPSATIYSLCQDRSTNGRTGALVMGVPDAVAPLIGDEVKAVAEIVPGAELLVGEKATAAVLREKGSQCRWIHIATHGHFRQDSPMFSGVRLGDSILNLYDLSNCPWS